MERAIILLRNIFLLLLLPPGVWGKTVPGIDRKASLCFIANVGQVRDQYGEARHDIDYKVSTPGLSVFVGKGQVHYQFSDSPNRYRMDVVLVGADVDALVIAEQELDYYERYYTVGFGADGAVAHAYSKITYKNIYPDIDWVLYIKDNQPEYDFVVRPGGDLHDIQIRYNGTTHVAVNQDGSLKATTPMGSISELKPYSYEQNNERAVASSFALLDNKLTFDIAPHGGTLVIDPKVQWATYYGGGSDDVSEGIALDPVGNAYITGTTLSTSNIATTGSFQSSFGGGMQAGSNFGGDAFIVKFNAAGNRRWATYYGGTGNENNNYGGSIVSDTLGNVYITGNTTSNNAITTLGSNHATLAGGEDGFLAKFDSTGARKWGTYIGGAGTDRGLSVASDGNNVYVAGITNSDTGIVTSGAFRTSPANSIQENSFLQKYTNSGQLLWGTYYCNIYATLSTTAVDPSGNVYLAGATFDTANVATSGSHQSHYGGGNCDGFLVKFNSSGTRQWATYYGGSGEDYIADVVFDKAGNIYMGGSTISAGGIATGGSYQDSAAVAHWNTQASTNAYIAKLNSAGIRLWGTYYTRPDESGGSERFSISFAGKNNIICSGIALTDTPSLRYPGFLGSFNINGQFEWDTTFTNFSNGNDNEILNICDTSGNIYLVGCTFGTTGQATAGAYQTSPGGNTEVLLIKLSMDTTVYIVKPFEDTGGCPGASFRLPYGVNFPFKKGNVFTAQLSDSSGSFASPVNIGSDTATTDTITYTIPATTIKGDHYRIRIVASNPPDTSLDDSVNIHVTGLRYAFNNNSPVCERDILKLTGLDSTAGIRYAWHEPHYTDTMRKLVRSLSLADSGNYYAAVTLYGCTVNDTVHVAVLPAPPIPVLSSNSPLCLNGNLRLGDSSTIGISYQWLGSNGYTSTLQNPVLQGVILADSGYYKLTTHWISPNACSVTDSIKVVIKAIPVPGGVTSFGSSPVCAGNSLQLNAASISAGVTYQWSGPNHFSSTTQDTTVTNATVADSGNYYVTVTLNGCTTTDTVPIVVNLLPIVTAGSNSPVCLGQPLNLTAASGATASYNWNGPGGFINTSQNPVKNNMAYTDTGNYMVNAVLNGCTSAPDTVHVVMAIGPANVTAGSNSPLCTGDTIKLFSGSTSTGVAFSWQGPGGYAANGANNTILNATPAKSGSYYLAATLNGCIIPATVTVVVNARPAVPTVGSNSPVCAGGDLDLTAASGTSGVTYTWSGPGYASAAQNPVIHAATTGNSGIYTATAALGGCSASAATNIVVKAAPTNVGAGSNSPLCAGQTLDLTATSTAVGVSYAWHGPGGYTSAAQNPVIANAPTAATGGYTVYISLNGCTDTLQVPVTVNDTTGPASITIAVSPSDSTCTGNTVTFTATAVNGGTIPVYQWKNGGSPVGTNSATYISSTLADLAQISCHLQSNAVCQAVSAATSNVITMHFVNRFTAPIVTIVSSGGNPRTFTVNTLGASGGLTYQWEKNGVPIAGATGSSYTGIVGKGDIFSVVVRSAIACMTPDSVVSKVTVGVPIAIGIAGGMDILVYPNPVNGFVVIEHAMGATMRICNVVGQVLLEQVLGSDKESISTERLAPGTFVLTLTNDDWRWSKVMVKE